MNKKATLAEIIAKKKQGDMDRLQVKYYSSEILGMDIEVRKIPLSQYLELAEEVEDGAIGAMNKMIYECCPMFRENTKEAMEVYEVSTPADLPSAILEDQLNEINGIIEIINSFYGIDKLDVEIKN
ncbi:hypothetical protein [Tissierella praeacuta]|uniref:hypothetical protein n=1 Tax=Tissierella praeacuta TaxID=43131 RepID=UPI003340DD8E